MHWAACSGYQPYYEAGQDFRESELEEGRVAGRIATMQKERAGIYYRARLVSIDGKEGGLSGEELKLDWGIF